jgi:hypothetical protein
MRFINENIKNKRVFVAFPPNRSNDEVRRYAKGEWIIGRKNLADSQFATTVINSGGESFTKPITWV